MIFKKIIKKLTKIFKQNTSILIFKNLSMIKWVKRENNKFWKKIKNLSKYTKSIFHIIQV